MIIGQFTLYLDNVKNYDQTAEVCCKFFASRGKLGRDFFYIESHQSEFIHMDPILGI